MKKLLLFILCALFGINLVCSQSILPFTKGDRVVFVGNSITCGGHYHSYIWLYYMTRFPNERVDFFNEGIGGDVAKQISMRTDKIFEHNPTVITLTFGMNDVGYMDFSDPKNEVIGKKNVKIACNDYQSIEEEYKKHSDVKKILIGSSPYDETSHFNKVSFPGKNTYIEQISDFLKERAEKNKWSFVDFNRPMVSINKREQQYNPDFTLCGNDRIHPSTDGHMVMAYLFLKAQGFTHKPVADIFINVSDKSIKRSENCRISDLDISSQKVSFIYQANSLPYPMDSSHYEYESHTQTDAMKVIPFMDEMNYEGLAISGLADGYYLLKIEGEKIARLTADELKRGVNMAMYGNTPQYKQAQQIRQMNEERWLIERQMREYYWMEYNLMRDAGMLWKSNEAAVDTLREHRKTNPFVRMNTDYWLRFMHKGIREDCENDQLNLVKRIYESNKPKALKIELIKL